MKKLRFLFIILVAFLILPFSVFAETATEDEDSDKAVNVYLFHGDGCPHCEDAQEWFSEIEDEYGDKFNLVSYEVWYSEENNSLMSAVAEVRGENADGVPYIIVGNQSWSGFDDSHKEPILNKIDSEYEQEVDERYDIMDYVSLSGTAEKESSAGRDVLILILILAVVGAGGYGIYVARKNTEY